MKRIITLIVAVLSCIVALAQTKPDEVVRLISAGKQVTLQYSLTVESGAPVQYNGVATIQEGAFLVKGNGLEIYCDGESLIVVDPKAKEIYVEKACSIQDYISSNIGKIKDPKISVTSTKEKAVDISAFKYDIKAKDSSWIITDIRQ